jgi:hypothetical protein
MGVIGANGGFAPHERIDQPCRRRQRDDTRWHRNGRQDADLAGIKSSIREP